MEYTQLQKTAILKSLLYVVDADGVFSIQEKQFLRWFSIKQNESLDPFMDAAKAMSVEKMQEVIKSLDNDTFREVKNLWYMCSFSDEIVAEELQVIIDLIHPRIEAKNKQFLTKEDIQYIIDTYDSPNYTEQPSHDFLSRFNELKTQANNRTIEDAFYDNQQLLDTLELFDFDLESFWNLVLFTKDVVEEKCASAYKEQRGVIEALELLRDTLDKQPKLDSCRNLSAKNEFPEDAYIEYKADLKLSLTANGKKIYGCDNHHALFLLAHACDHLLKDHSNIHPDFSCKLEQFPSTRKYAMFYSIMKRFLDGKKTKTTNTNRSSDTHLLVARVLHAIGWLDSKYIESHDVKRYTTNKKFRELIKNYEAYPCKGFGFNTVYYQGIDV